MLLIRASGSVPMALATGSCQMVGVLLNNPRYSPKSSDPPSNPKPTQCPHDCTGTCPLPCPCACPCPVPLCPVPCPQILRAIPRKTPNPKTMHPQKVRTLLSTNSVSVLEPKLRNQNPKPSRNPEILKNRSRVAGSAGPSIVTVCTSTTCALLLVPCPSFSCSFLLLFRHQTEEGERNWTFHCVGIPRPLTSHHVNAK